MDEQTAEKGSPCVGCNVREPWEHRCEGAPCVCEECREADRLFPGAARPASSVLPPTEGRA